MLLVRHGVLLAGRLNKAAVGVARGSLAHVLHNASLAAGAPPPEIDARVCALVDGLSFMAIHYLTYRGFSVGVGDARLACAADASAVKDMAGAACNAVRVYLKGLPPRAALPPGHEHGHASEGYAAHPMDDARAEAYAARLTKRCAACAAHDALLLLDHRRRRRREPPIAGAAAAGGGASGADAEIALDERITRIETDIVHLQNKLVGARARPRLRHTG